MNDPYLSRSFERSSLFGLLHSEEDKVYESQPVSEEQAWSLANQGYQFDFGFEVGSLSELDLADLFLNPVKETLSLQDYKDLQQLSRDQLLRKAAGIEVFYPDIDDEKIFFYLTRGFLPNDANISFKLEGYHRFEKYLQSTQETLLIMYKDVIDYANNRGRYPNLERVLDLYDEMLGCMDTIPLISKMFGVKVYGVFDDGDEYLIDKIRIYIAAFINEKPSQKEVPFANLEEVVGMGKPQWERTYKSSYDVRSDYIMKTFYDNSEVQEI